MSSELHGPPNRRDRQVPPSPRPPDSAAPEAGSDSSTLLRTPQPWSGDESPATDEGAGFSTMDGRRTPVENRTVSLNRSAEDDRPTTRQTSTPGLKGLESTVRRFEMEWKRGREPRIDDYLAQAGTQRATLLTELVNTDLECRLKAGRAFLVELYLSRYPELGEVAAVNLIVRDFALRRRRGMLTT